MNLFKQAHQPGASIYIMIYSLKHTKSLLARKILNIMI